MGFQKDLGLITEEDLASAMTVAAWHDESIVGNVDASLLFAGFRECEPEDFCDLSSGGDFPSLTHSKGRLGGRNADELVSEIMESLGKKRRSEDIQEDQSSFDRIHAAYQAGSLAPVIAVDGRKADGWHRSVYCYLIGKPVLVADFHVKKQK